MPLPLKVNEGDKYNQLTIIKEVEQYVSTAGNSYRRFLCKCSCGQNKEFNLSTLRSGLVVSCGCYQDRIRGQSRKIHGMSNSPEFLIWQSAKSRCENPNNKSFKNYGGRGIQFRFKTFQDFFNEIGERPGKGFTLDRIDNDGHYEVGNVRWATHKQQALNKRLKSGNKTGYKGIYKKGNSFIAEFQREYLGSYKTPEEAANAYDKAAIKLQNIDVPLNFPNPK